MSIFLKDSLKVGEYYTRHLSYLKITHDDRCIFKYKGKGTNDEHIKAIMVCSTFQEEYYEDIEFEISKKGIGINSYITLATEEEIDFLFLNKKLYDEGYFNIEKI